MNRNNLDRFHLIAVFVAVVEARSLAGAARKLNLSPPAVTRAIHALESQLGLRLLTRTTRSVRVTDAGERYAQDCRRILAEMQDADDSVCGLHAEPRGRLVVTAPVLFGGQYVTPLVTEYLLRFPEVQASCLFLDRVVHLLDEGVDVAIRIGELPDSSLQAVRVGQVRRVVCASPQYLEAHGVPASPQDLADHRIVSAGGTHPQVDWKFVEQGVVQSQHLRARLTTSTNDAARTAAVAGFGLTRLLSYQVAEQLQAGTLQILLANFEPEPQPIHVVHRQGRQAPQRVRAFLDFVIERLRGDSSLGYEAAPPARP